MPPTPTPATPAWRPPTADAVSAHLAAHRPTPPPASRRLAPLIPLAVAAVGALAIGGVAWVLPWLALVGTSAWARALLARRQRRQRRIERAHELVRLRYNRAALRTAWRMLPELVEHPGLHHTAVSVLARGLEQTRQVDAALVCLDHLDALVPGNPRARAGLGARRISALLDSGRLADAHAALGRLRSAARANAHHQPQLALAELDYAVATAHYHDAIEESPALIATLRPLGLGAARGYALRALCHHHRATEGDDHAAHTWWQHATSLTDAASLVASLPATQVLAQAVPAHHVHAHAPLPTDAAPPAAEPHTDPSNDHDDTPPWDFTPQRLRRELSADRWLRRGVMCGLPALVLTAGLLTPWPLPVAMLSAFVVIAVGGAALLLLQAPVVVRLPALAPLTESTPPAAVALLRSLSARRGLAAPLRRALYHGAAKLAHRRGAPGDRAAAAALATELLATGPGPNTSSPAAAMSTSPPHAALLLIVAQGHLAAGHLAAAYPALAALARTAVTLDQGLERLALQTRYEHAVGDDTAALHHARAKADLAALMPAPACRRLHRDLLAAAQRSGDADTLTWLSRRVALLG